MCGDEGSPAEDRPEPEPLARVHHDMSGRGSVTASVVAALAEAADLPPVQLRRPLYDAIDPDALDALFQPTLDGTPRAGGAISFLVAGHEVTVRADGTITVASELDRLREAGGNLLVVGTVPGDVMDAASAMLLGDPGTGRRPVIALADPDAAPADDRLARARVPPDRARAVAYRATGSRRASGSPGEAGTGLVSVTEVDGDLSAFHDAIAAAVEATDREAGGLAPAELRLCLDSLGPLVSAHDRDVVAGFVDGVCAAIESVAGVGHFLLPAARDDPAVAAVEDQFDAVVELRTGTDGPEQRWHFAGSGHATRWLEL